jgi:hypothetical protein
MKRIALIAFAILLVGCPALFADSLAFDPDIWNIISARTIGGEPVGPYPMRLNESTSDIYLWCISYQQSPDWQSFTVEKNTTEYGAQAYVLSMLNKNFDGTDINNEIVQWALWYLLSSDYVTDSTKRYRINGLTAQEVLNSWKDMEGYEWINVAIALADEGASHPLTSGYEVYVDQTNDYQSFIQMVPEPSLILLLGIGVGVAGLTALRKRN